MKHLFFFLICITQLSCVKTFVPGIDQYQELMVVDGEITDAPGPYTIKLSTSSGLKTAPKFNAYTNCRLYIEDDLGNKAALLEQSPGIYKTDSLTFRGIPGRKYRLNILTPDGDSCQSTQDLLKAPLGIRSVYAEFQHKTHPDLFYGRDGYQFYVDTETPVTPDHFLYWKLQCTYKFKADVTIVFYYDQWGVHRVIAPDTLKTCYRTNDIQQLYLLNTSDLKQKEIQRFPLNYEDNYTKALSIRYSLKVSQYSLDEAAYNYWNAIRKMSDNGGQMYTTQPYLVKNNLKNISHPEKPVLGYFTVAGVSEKRIFVNAPPVMEKRYAVCERQNDSMPTIIDQLKNSPELWPIFLTYHLEWLDQECLDCRLSGTLRKPDFWID